MAELYKKVGRGGAGNFYSKKAAEESRESESADIEAQSFNPNDLAKAISTSQPPPEYLHTGRGGAGNWVQPSDLTAKGLAQVSPTTVSPASGPRKTSVISKPTYRGGRGGAGNYTDFAEEERLRMEEEERLRKETEERIARDVEAGLSRPAKAYGGIGGSWEMGPLK